MNKIEENVRTEIQKREGAKILGYRKCPHCGEPRGVWWLLDGRWHYGLCRFCGGVCWPNA